MGIDVYSAPLEASDRGENGANHSKIGHDETESIIAMNNVEFFAFKYSFMLYIVFP